MHDASDLSSLIMSNYLNLGSRHFDFSYILLGQVNRLTICSLFIKISDMNLKEPDVLRIIDSVNNSVTALYDNRAHPEKDVLYAKYTAGMQQISQAYQILAALSARHRSRSLGKRLE